MKDRIVYSHRAGKKFLAGLIIEGVERGLKEWADLVSVDPNTIRCRIGKGMKIKDAVFIKSEYSGPHDPMFGQVSWPVPPSVLAQTKGKAA